MVHVPIKKNPKKALSDMAEDPSTLKTSLAFFTPDTHLKKMFFLYIDTLYANASKLNSLKEM